MSTDLDPETRALVAEINAGRMYCQRLRDAGLWGLTGQEIVHRHLDKMMISQQVYAEIGQTYGVNLPMFALDKAETREHAEELAEQWVEEHSGLNDLTAEEFWDSVWSRPNHDRDNPDLLLTLIEHDCLTEEATRELLASVWMHTEFPGSNGGIERWRDAFDAAGWISDDDSPLPREPVTLYRGAVPDHQRGLSWTADPERAAWFATRFSHTESQALVYRRTFQPRELLARFTGRGENEYVVWIDPDDDTEQDWADPR